MPAQRELPVELREVVHEAPKGGHLGIREVVLGFWPKVTVRAPGEGTFVTPVVSVSADWFGVTQATRQAHPYAIPIATPAVCPLHGVRSALHQLPILEDEIVVAHLKEAHGPPLDGKEGFEFRLVGVRMGGVEDDPGGRLAGLIG